MSRYEQQRLWNRRRIQCCLTDNATWSVQAASAPSAISGGAVTLAAQQIKAPLEQAVDYSRAVLQASQTSNAMASSERILHQTMSVVTALAMLMQHDVPRVPQVLRIQCELQNMAVASTMMNVMSSGRLHDCLQMSQEGA